MNPLVVLAAEATPGPVTVPWWHTLLNPFALALTFLFLAAVIGAFVAARKSDRCLRKFRDFPVTVQEQAGRTIWGRLRVFSKGLELLFEKPYDHPAKNSFLIYEPEAGRILAFYRFTDRLQGKDADRRARQARRLAAPSLGSRLWRWMRNIVNTFRDAIVQALGMSIQQATRAAPGAVLSAGGGQITSIGTTLIGETANAYEPMLEQYIGDPVILEVINPADSEKRKVEYHGYLGEYSPQFVLLVGARRRFHEEAPLTGAETRLMEDAVRIRAANGRLVVENDSAVTVVVEGIHAGEGCHEMSETVPAGQRREIPLPDAADAAGTSTALSYDREFDLIVPRACAWVRHASEAPTPPGDNS